MAKDYDLKQNMKPKFYQSLILMTSTADL